MEKTSIFVFRDGLAVNHQGEAAAKTSVSKLLKKEAVSGLIFGGEGGWGGGWFLTVLYHERRFYHMKSSEGRLCYNFVGGEWVWFLTIIV